MSSQEDYNSEEDLAAAEAWSDWSDDESEEVQSLFSQDKFRDAEAAILFDTETHNFNLAKYIQQHQITSEYDIFKVINYIRSEMAAGKDPRPTLANSQQPWNDESYLTPVLPNDGFLLHDWDEYLASKETNTDREAASNVNVGNGEALEEGGGMVDLAAENEALRAALLQLQSMALQEGGLADILGEVRPNPAEADGAGTSAAATADNKDSETKEQHVAAQQESAAAAVDAAYFDSYSSFDIHHQMLADRERTLAYLEALEHNPLLLKGAKVLDVGCGTGVLSMFAARGGAASVAAVDGSAEMAIVTTENIAANGFSNVISVASGRIETLKTLPGVPEGEKVDVLVSEWMGYALLFETMLDSVLHARDTFLKPGGAVLPDIARIYIAAAGKGATGLKFWQSVYGLNMSPVANRLHSVGMKEGIVRVVNPEDVYTESQLLMNFDLAGMKAEEQDFSAPFELTLKPSLTATTSDGGGSGKEGAEKQQTVVCEALVLWFDVLFSERFCKDRAVEMSTSFDQPPTHWAQTVFLLPEAVTLTTTTNDNNANDGSGAPTAVVAIKGRLSMARRTAAHRCLDISIEYAAVYKDGQQGETKTHMYAMGVSGSS